ncbi:mammalian ependymin-related protein 1-like [Mytilus galloprovincialis]|uniref:mammalian ependymin-related protein 1-like n=1 Tax=Mytilus galloprovincialis TaxID=29158 RepID=UPI003F7BCDF5
MKLFVALCCFVLAQAQIPTRCDPPKQWEGKIHRVARGSSVQPENERVKISYDETNQRVREISDSPLIPKPGQAMYEVIYLHQTKKEYRINLATRKCNVSTITRPFMSVGIPPNATFNGFASFGIHAISGQSLDIQDWETSVYDNRFSVVLTTDCVPVQYTHYIPPSSTIVSTYFDINLGINDESVFTPPSECN